MKKSIKFGGRPMSLYVYQAQVLKVTDGDTLYVEFDLGFSIRHKAFVRLLEVDTPEVFGPKHVPEGKWASAYTKLWCMNRELEYDALRKAGVEPVKGQFDAGPFISVYVDVKKYDARDKYGRCLGDIFKDGASESLNQALIRMGWPVSPKSWGMPGVDPYAKSEHEEGE
jgi:endonuclease YncB( thermonuclease family)